MHTLVIRAACRVVLALAFIALVVDAAQAERKRSRRSPAPAQQVSPQEELARKHYELAETYKAAGKHSEAVAEYLKAYELVPRPSLLFNAAQALWLAHDIEEAIEHYVRYLALEPTGPGADRARAQIHHAAEQYWEVGELDLALGHHARYLAVTPHGPHADEARERFFAAAERHRSAGDAARAVAAYERYLAVAPEGAAAHRARAHLDSLRAERSRAQDGAEPGPEAAPGEPAGEESVAVAAHGAPAAPARPSAVRWSAVLHAAFDHKARGAVAVLGVGAGLGPRLELRAAAVLGPTPGAYLGGVAYLARLGPLRPLLAAGLPVFFSHGPRVGVRASLGVAWPALERVDALVELAAEHYINAGWNHEHTVLVPMLGVRAHL